MTAAATFVGRAFLISWTPYAFVSFWTVFGDTKALPILVKTLPQLMAKCASVWNPIIYVSTNKQFRSAFFAMFMKQCTSLPNDTNTMFTTRLATTKKQECHEMNMMIKEECQITNET
ncbi:hypothetical protein KUTeg_004499 [Tegillarca granosa]|uniref:G-protein coupled receptors family 1 profile domain-containing protein n=1 Tax=Tegillarca granosa TaxID=220873 RepID=A0ABQ9FUN3_TEGGR|nr:hypothetical protein KUTeg_004499 [Tegillarca granosa]